MRSGLLHGVAIASATAAALLTPTAAHGHHRPSAYCSPTGDYCQSAKRGDRGGRSLKFAAFSFRGRVTVCVRRRGGGRACRRDRFRDRDGDGIYVARTCWQCRFQSGRRGGAYTVTWKQHGTRIGRQLGFHAR